MLLLDLRWLLAAFLLLLVLTALVAVWLDRWLHQRSHPMTVFEEAEGWTFLERLPFGVLLLDEGGCCRYANPAARRLLKLSVPPSPLPPVPWAAQLEEDRLELRAHEEPVGRFRTVPTEGEQVVRWWLTAWGAWGVVVVQDATAQQRAEQGARFLISDLSHELRTPLATLLTHLEVLRLKHLARTRHMSNRST